jgi:hypothetical protein
MEKEQAIERGKELLRELRERYKHDAVVGRMTGVYRKRLPEIEAGRASVAMTTKFVEAAESIEKEQAGAVPGNVMEALGGETSPLGVQYVLGPVSFKQLDVQEMQEFMPILRRAIERARAMLNIAAQFRSEESRARLQREAAREVEELELAIRLFTAQFPNRLTELHDAQRLTWADDKRRNSKRSKR